MADARKAAARPLSPHLQIYKPIPTMIMSILHRITGAALYGATILFAWWLIAAASGPDYFTFVNGLFGSIPGRIVLFAITWTLMHHALGGLRHFIWDMGRGFGVAERETLTWLTALGAPVLTLLVWIVAYMVRGG